MDSDTNREQNDGGSEPTAEGDTTEVEESVPSQSPSPNRDEELNQLREAQLAAVKRENELKRRTVEALRREVKERVDAFSSLAEEERKKRRSDVWWSELLQRREGMATRVRRACDMWSGPKKTAEANKLCHELEKRRRLLAAARARLMQETKNEELLEEVQPCRNLHLQSHGQDRSCASCGYRSAEEEENDDTIPEAGGAGSETANEAAGAGRGISEAEGAFLAHFGNRAAAAGISTPRAPSPTAQPSAAAGTPRVNYRQEQMDADFLLALALQEAEVEAPRAPRSGRGGRGGGVGQLRHM